MWNEPTPEEMNRLPRVLETCAIPLAERVIHQHYFLEKCDWYVVEYDPKARILFGYTALGKDLCGPGWGYIGFDMLRHLVTASGEEVGRNLYWEPKKAYEVDRIRAAYKRCREW